MSDTIASVVSYDQATADIKQRIQELEELAGDDLENAMKQLKRALMENPSACELILPQEIGLMVSALRQITGTHAVTMASKPKGRAAAKPKALSAAEMDAAFNEL